MREHLWAFVALINLNGLDEFHLRSLSTALLCPLLQELHFSSGLVLA